MAGITTVGTIIKNQAINCLCSSKNTISFDKAILFFESKFIKTLSAFIERITFDFAILNFFAFIYMKDMRSLEWFVSGLTRSAKYALLIYSNWFIIGMLRRCFIDWIYNTNGAVLREIIVTGELKFRQVFFETYAIMVFLS